MAAKKKPKVAPKPYTPARVKKLVANKDTRRSVPDRFLPKPMLAERQRIAHSRAPVAPGSALTYGQLGQDTKSYMTQKYGPGDVAERQGISAQEGVNRDTTGWYSQYLKDLQTHAANINTFADQNVQQTAGFGAAANRAGQQATAGQTDPVSQGINAQAADTRARYAGSFAGQASAVGTANKNQASNMANVVGPGQALQAKVSGARTLTTLKEKATARADAKGADASLYRSNAVTNEQKIAAADAIAQGKSATEAAKIAGRTTVAKIGASTKTPPVPYYTWAQWKSMTPAQKRAAVKDYQKKPSTVKPKTVKPTKKPADKGGLKSTDPQTRFGAAYSQVAASTHDGKPIDGAYARTNATTIVNSLVAQGLTRRLALRVVSAYIKNGGRNPGSFKDYGKPGSPAIPGN